VVLGKYGVSYPDPPVPVVTQQPETEVIAVLILNQVTVIYEYVEEVAEPIIALIRIGNVSM
jgi:hypothetical protein